ncbi:DUF2269 family protein [Pseudalkalibacillus sp. SCS-8]|uniref:DUF2269 family protein n=1 Tax=Pseudalkalibacillus nanhaiensis TaxID=3115291 RepID=UPI0032DBAABE
MLVVLNLLALPLGFLLILYVMMKLGNRKKKKFKPKQKNNWLIAHILSIIVYFSGLLGTLLMALTTNFTEQREMIYAAHLFIQYFDWFLIIPGGVAAFITGVWLSVRTHWGVTRYYWIIAKWVGTIGAIFFGANFMRVWLHDNFSEIFSSPTHPLENAFYLSNRLWIYFGLGLSFTILIFLVIISYLKPWGKRVSTQQQPTEKISQKERVQ